jgi:hypothetical protein
MDARVKNDTLTTGVPKLFGAAFDRARFAEDDTTPNGNLIGSNNDGLGETFSYSLCLCSGKTMH